MAIPSTIPETIHVGDTITFTRSWSDYLPPTWTLTFYMVKDDGSGSYKFEAADNGDGTHLVTISAANSAKLTVGVWGFTERVDDSSTYTTVNSGALKVVPDLSLASDMRSHAKKALDAIEAKIEDRATRDQEAMRFGDREIRHTPMTDLIVLRDKYRAEVKLEEQADRVARGLSTKGKIVTRFG